MRFQSPANLQLVSSRLIALVSELGYANASELSQTSPLSPQEKDLLAFASRCYLSQQREITEAREAIKAAHKTFKHAHRNLALALKALDLHFEVLNQLLSPRNEVPMRFALEPLVAALGSIDIDQNKLALTAIDNTLNKGRRIAQSLYEQVFPPHPCLTECHHYHLKPGALGHFLQWYDGIDSHCTDVENQQQSYAIAATKRNECLNTYRRVINDCAKVMDEFIVHSATNQRQFVDNAIALVEGLTIDRSDTHAMCSDELSLFSCDTNKLTIERNPLHGKLSV
uniref:hypothetical protein n=1 Tax=Thaumasiovibrio occultus TaxID=1891184 RepID=UPI000B3507FA|nr:hypothetical protein [Thaumasiovibrio occultus]